MGTPLETVYEAFTNLILSNEWEDFLIQEAKEDWKLILNAAIPWFKFPHMSLEIDEENDCFVEEITNQEVQILAHYMKCEWLGRSIHTYQNLGGMYDERDYSPANMLAQLKNDLEAERYNAAQLESYYYRRSTPILPYEYSKLSGKGNEHHRR